MGTFAIAALLVGGASIKKATIGQAVLGALLFHTMFIISPIAGKNLFDNAQLGEYFRVFACYAVIAVALALHAWKRLWPSGWMIARARLWKRRRRRRRHE